MQNVIQLHKLGYCGICKKPFLAGDFFREIRTPDGSEKVHAECMGPDDQPPTNGGSPVALAA